MAPKTGKAKPHRAKGEKKKKEEKVLPTVLDITVQAPDFSHLTLKGISTDRILDVRKLLAVHVDACHFTCYSLSHEVRGPRLKDAVDIVSLKPCHVTIIEEEYTEELAVAHIRRLLDIIACTTAFTPPPAKNVGPSTSPDANSPTAGTRSSGGISREHDSSVETSDSILKPQRESNKSGSISAAVGAPGANQKEEAAIYPPPKLGQFYDFFSFFQLTPPLQYIRRSVRPFVEDKRVDDFFQIDVRFCNGKLVTIVACRIGFYPAGKRALISRSADHSMDLVIFHMVSEQTHGWSLLLLQILLQFFLFFLQRMKLGVEVVVFKEEMVNKTMGNGQGNFQSLLLCLAKRLRRDKSEIGRPFGYCFWS